MRWSSGQQTTDRTFTGQRMDASFGLMNYNARYYDPYLNRWIQPDSIVPNSNNPLAYDRYAYGFNNPLKYNDPTGHLPIDEILDVIFIAYDVGDIFINGPTPMNEAALAADLVCAAIPYGTGGGLAVRAGGEAAVEGLLHLPSGARALQLAEKFAQFAVSSDGIDSSNNSDTQGSNSPNPDNVNIPQRKADQVSKRGWTLDSIKDVIENPALTRNTADHPDVYNRANGNSVTYYYRADGHYVVIDDVTGQVVQVSDTYNPQWIDEMTNDVIQPIDSE